MPKVYRRNQNQTPLWTALKNYKETDIVHYDVPGHKQSPNAAIAEAYGKDIIELDTNSTKPLDNMSNPIGVIREAELLMADAYDADYAFFLVNGTTQGVQGMIMSVCKPGDKILMPRNVHKSAIQALILCGGVPIYMQPEIDLEYGIANSVTFETVKAAIHENPDAKAIFMINPTYYGVASNLAEIVKFAHRHGLLVLVDEAHGAHFPFHEQFPLTGMEAGADLASVSLHKMGGSLTQTAALLIKEEYITRERVKAILNITQTTSSSYLLMSSLDIARQNLVQHGEEIFGRSIMIADYGREKINQIDGLKTFTEADIGKNGVYNFDKTKLVIKVSELGITGHEVYDILRDDYRIQVEFGDAHNILAVLGTDDTYEMMDIFIAALEDISKKYKTDKKLDMIQWNLITPEVMFSPRDAFYCDKVSVKLEESAGLIAGESIMAYPPGIPIVAAGERITEEMVRYIIFLKNAHSILVGTEDQMVHYIRVLKEDQLLWP